MAEQVTREQVLTLINILKECQEKNFIENDPAYVRSVILPQNEEGVESEGLKDPRFWKMLTPDEQTYVNNILAQVSN